MKSCSRRMKSLRDEIRLRRVKDGIQFFSLCSALLLPYTSYITDFSPVAGYRSRGDFGVCLLYDHCAGIKTVVLLFTSVLCQVGKREASVFNGLDIAFLSAYSGLSIEHIAFILSKRVYYLLRCFKVIGNIRYYMIAAG